MCSCLLTSFAFQAENEREEKYFNELEKKEQLEDKMKTITEIKVNVVSCKQVRSVVFAGCSEALTMGHFTVVCSVPWSLNRSEAGANRGILILTSP